MAKRGAAGEVWYRESKNVAPSRLQADLSWPLGLSVASGVPVLVLIAANPVTALVGAPSVLVWLVSSGFGGLMAVCFADLAVRHPEQTGGIGILAARVMRERSPRLAQIAQWGYWLGWSPALAISASMAGRYLRGRFAPESPDWTTWIIAVAILGATVAINYFGIRPSAWLQLGLAVVAGVLLTGAAGWSLAADAFSFDQLRPFSPPHGWTSAAGISAIAGGLFLAAWSGYGAEVALSYSSEYQRGSRGAVRALFATAAITVLAHSLFSLVIVGTVGVDDASGDPLISMLALARRLWPPLTAVVGPLLIVTLLLGLNMLAIASSRTLHQMARNGDAPAWLAHLNRYGVPGHALWADASINVAMLAVSLALNGGRSADVPAALVAAANVGYLVAIVLALIAFLQARSDGPGEGLRIPRAFAAVAGAGVAFNLLLLAAAGAAWGWRNITQGGVALLVVLAVTRRFPWLPRSHEGD